MAEESRERFQIIQGLMVVAILGAGYVFWPKIEPYISRVLGYGSDLEVIRDEVNVGSFNGPVYFPRLTITNKGRDEITITGVQVNGRTEPACGTNTSQKLKTGGYIVVNPALGCGKPVRVNVSTDRGSSEFEW